MRRYYFLNVYVNGYLDVSNGYLDVSNGLMRRYYILNIYLNVIGRKKRYN